MAADGPVTVGSYPRDDVFGSWAADGLERSGESTVLAVDGRELGRVVLGDLDVVTIDAPAGAALTVRITGRFDGRVLTRVARLRVTRNEHDVETVTVGPGTTVERRRWHRRRHHGFECGVLVSGAVVWPDPAT